MCFLELGALLGRHGVNCPCPLLERSMCLACNSTPGDKQLSLRKTATYQAPCYCSWEPCCHARTLRTEGLWVLFHHPDEVLGFGEDIACNTRAPAHDNHRHAVLSGLWLLVTLRRAATTPASAAAAPLIPHREITEEVPVPIPGPVLQPPSTPVLQLPPTSPYLAYRWRIASKESPFIDVNYQTLSPRA